MKQIKYSSLLMALLLSPLSSELIAATDPIKWMTCETAQKESQSNWFPGDGDYSKNVEAKLDYCTDTGAYEVVTTDPYSWMSCDKAKRDSETAWYAPDEGGYSAKVEAKLEYCQATGEYEVVTTDPYPWISCDKAKSKSETNWYDPSKGGYSAKVEAKLNYCQATGAYEVATTDPYPWMSCNKAISESETNWYDPSKGGYSAKVAAKLAYCQSVGMPPVATGPEVPAPEAPAPEEPTPEVPAPEEPAPEEPVPEEPAPEEPAPEEPAPEEPAPEEPAPEEPAPEEPAPEEPAPEVPDPDESGQVSTAGVWPGTETRFFPGIYVYTDRNNPTPETCSNAFNTMFGEGADRWVYRDEQGNPKSYLGCFVQIELKKLYKDERRAPHAYAGQCSRSETAQDPNWDNYNWEYIEGFLNLPMVKEGGAKIYLQLQGTYAAHSPLPTWMHTQDIGYQYPSVYNGSSKWSLALWRRQTQYALMDLGHALGKRFKGDERLAAIHLPESFEQTRYMPSDYPQDGAGTSTPCGIVANLDRGAQAMRQGRIFQAHGIKEGDPNLMVIVMNAAARVEEGYAGEFSRRDMSPSWGNKPLPMRWGLKDLPGQWGVSTNGALMFQNGCGTNAFGQHDCQGWALDNVQRHALANDRVVSVDAQSREWIIDKDYLNGSCCRYGDENPWGSYSWDGVYAFWPGQNGKLRHIPTPAEWAWYYSGEPKKQGSAGDSGLGQYGRDPGGVIPAHYFVVRNLPVPAMVDPDDRSVVVDTRTPENYAEAFDTFGPTGTGAMISFPEGY